MLHVCRTSQCYSQCHEDRPLYEREVRLADALRSYLAPRTRCHQSADIAVPLPASSLAFATRRHMGRITILLVFLTFDYTRQLITVSTAWHPTPCHSSDSESYSVYC